MKTSLDKMLARTILEKALELSQHGLTPDAAAVASEAKVEPSAVERLFREVAMRFGSLRRVTLGLAAVGYGADPQRLTRYLTWQEMEEFVSEAAEASGLSSVKNLHLKINGRRIQIDLLAYTPSHCIIFECKRWSKRLAGQTLDKVASQARNRTIYVAEMLAAKKPGTHAVFFTTVVLTVYEPAVRHLGDVYILPATVMPELLRNHSNLLSSSTTHKKLSETWFELFCKQLKS